MTPSKEQIGGWNFSRHLPKLYLTYDFLFSSVNCNGEPVSWNMRSSFHSAVIKNAALLVSQISFTIKSAYTAGVLFVWSASYKIVFTPTWFHASLLILHKFYNDCDVSHVHALHSFLQFNACVKTIWESQPSFNTGKFLNGWP